MPGIIGRTGWDRSSAWTCDFSSTHSTSARSGGSRYSPMTSRTLSMNWGSLDSLKVSVSCGLSRNAFQIRPTVDLLSPDRLAIDARDQWVASVGGLLQGGDHHRLDLLVADSPGCARPWLIDQPLQSAGHKPRPPLTHRRQRHPEFRGDLLVGG